MSFLRTIEIINKIPLMMYRKILNYKHIFDIRRKEEGFDFLPDLIAISCVKEKASVSASVTVEAVLCVPLFLYAAVSLIWMLELRSIQSAVRCGLQSAGKQVAESFAEIPVLNPISLHADLVNAVGKERMDRSMIVGGSGGVSCKRSWAIPGMGVLELTAEYEVELPVPVFHIPVLHYKEKMRMKTWTGYVKTYEAGIGDNELVYVTETGIVYHRNYQCTYLEPSVRSVAKTQLGELRNSSGGIYHLCERCGWMPGNDGNCYVTDYGDRYHTSLSCSGLKRKVYTVPLSEVKGKGACSKCGGKGQVVYTSQSFFGDSVPCVIWTDALECMGCRTGMWNCISHDIEMVTGGNRVRRQLDDPEYGYFSWDLESAWNADACISCGCDGSRSRSLERKMETDDKNVILSFSSDRLSGDIYMVKLKGSTVVEMAYLMPVVLLCWMAVIFALFYYHDKNIIGGAAYETAIVGSEEWRWKKEIEDGKMEQYFQKRIENKLIFFDTVSVETVVVKDEFEVTAGAQKRKMRVSVKRSAALTVPEEKIRRKKVLQEIVERDQEE